MPGPKKNPAIVPRSAQLAILEYAANINYETLMINNMFERVISKEEYKSFLNDVKLYKNHLLQPIAEEKSEKSQPSASPEMPFPSKEISKDVSTEYTLDKIDDLYNKSPKKYHMNDIMLIVRDIIGLDNNFDLPGIKLSSNSENQRV